MNSLKRYLALAALLILPVLGLQVFTPRAAVGQSSSSGVDDVVVGGSVSAGSPALIVSAVSGRRLVVKAIVLTSDQAGTVSFVDGASTYSLPSFYVAANTPITVDELVLGKGFATTSGNDLYIDGPASCTIKYCLRVRRD